MVQDLADLGQGGSIPEHVGGKAVTKQVGAFAWRIKPGP